MKESAPARVWGVAACAAPLLAFAALAWTVIAGRAAGFDAQMRAIAHDASSPGLTSAMLALTSLGSVALVSTISVAAFAGYYWARRRRSAWLLAATMVGSAALENGLKFAFHRARPEPFFDLATPESFSFPSGHALFSACLYGAIAWRLAAGNSPARRIAVWAITLALIATIGFSRIYLGLHYPSDVLGGWLVGAAWLALVMTWNLARISHNTE